MTRPLVYLAIPYTHDDPLVEEARFQIANQMAGRLMNCGYIAYSPISHCHPIAKKAKLPTDWEYWKKMAEAYLSCCNTMYVVCIDGWKESVGVQDEIKIATKLGIEIKYLTIYDLDSVDLLI